MELSFNFGTELINFLFHGINATAGKGFAAVCVIVGLVAIFVEAVKALQVYLKYQMHPIQQGGAQGATARTPLLQSLVTPAGVRTMKQRRIWLHLCQALLHVLALIGGYMLMLAVMTYNAWIAISTVLAFGMGYFIFGAMRSTLRASTERAQISSQQTNVLEHPAGPSSSNQLHTTPRYGYNDNVMYS